MSSFGSGSTTTAGSSIVLTAFEGTNGVKAGTDGLVPGPAVAQAGYLLGAGGDWVLTTPAIVGIAENSERIATTRFVQAVIANAQIPGGNANLSALGDVGIANLAAGQFLQYNDGSGDWENITFTLDTISNVNLAGLQEGQAIVWDGAEWVPGNIGAVNNLTDLGDVTLAGAADKHFLVHNGAGQFVNRLISSADLSNSANITLADGTVAFTGNVSFGDNNITNVGDIALDTISSDGTTILVSMTDDTGSAFSIKEGNNTYLRVDTTDNSEQIVLEKPTSFSSTAIFENNVVVNESGNGIDFRIETGTETHAIFTSGGTDRVGIFQDNPQVPLDIVGDTKITGALELTGNISAANLGTASASNVGDFLASNAVLNDLSGVVIGGVALGVNQVLMYTGANQFENRPLASTLLSDTGNLIRVSSSIGDLGDVNLAGLAGGEILVYSADDNEWKPTGQGAVYGDEQARNAVATALANGVNTGITFANDDANDRINATVSLNGFSIRDLSDVANGVLVNGKILKVVNGVLTQADESTITNEQVEDLVGGMVDGGTQTDITVTYDDNAGKLNFVVDNTIARLNDPDLTGTPTAPTANIVTDNTQIATTAFVHSLIDSDINALNFGDIVESDIADFLPSNADINDLGGVSTAGANPGQVLKFDVNGDLAPQDDSGKTQEQIEDIVGGMVGATTDITVTYNDGGDGGGGNISYSVDNTIARLDDPDFTGTPTAPTAANATNNTQLATTAFVHSLVDADIAALNLANTYQAKDASLDTITGIADGDLLLGNGANSFEKISVNQGVENFLKGNGGIRDLSDTNFNLDYLVNANHFMVSNGNGALVNQTISTANLSNSANIVLTSAGFEFGAFTYDFRTNGSVLTVRDPVDAGDASTKGYVDTQVATKQDSDATLTALAGLATGAKKLVYSNTGDDDLEMISLSDNAKTFIASDAELGDLDKVTIAGDIGAGNDGETLRWDGANLEWKNSKLAFGDLNQNVASTQNVALLNQEQTFSNNITFTAEVDLTGATTTAETVANNNAEGNSNRVATTAFVKTVLNQVGGVSDLDDLTDVNLGVKVVEVDGENVNDGVALANAQILVYDSDGGNNDNTFKNVPISGDITITNAGVAELADNSVTSAKIEDGSVANAKLQTPYLDLTVGANTDRLNLGETFTVAGTANEIEVAGLADAPGANAGATLTIGLPDDVTIGQDLTVTRDLAVTRNLEVTGNLTVNGTTTTVDTTNLDIEDAVIRLNKNVDGEANGRDIGIFMERGTDGQDAIFYFDEGEDIFKLGTTTSAHTATDFDATTTFGTLKLATLTTTSDSTVGGALGVTGLLNADGGIEIDNNGNKFTVSNAGAVVSVGGITDITTASAFASNTTIGNLTLANGSITDSGGSIDFGDENLSTSGNLTINTDKFVVTGATGNLEINTNKFTVAGATGNTLVAGTLEVTLGATFTAGLSANDQNITNVADIALDTISSDGDAIAIVLDDGVDSALVIREGANNYITVDTTDNAELITFEKNVIFNGTTNISANFDQAITINDSGNDADFRVEGSSQENLLFTDAGNDRVGINTNTPSTQFHVAGDTTLVGAITHDSGAVVFNNGVGAFDFNVKGDGDANLFYVDASADMIGIGKNDPSKTLDITGTVGISSTLDVEGKTTLAGSLDLETTSTTGITFRSEVANNGADAGDNVTLLRVNAGAEGFKQVLWNPDSDRFEVESGLKSTGNFAVGNDVATINATTGVTSIKGQTTINNSGGTADLIVQNNGQDRFVVDVSASTTTVTGQLKTDDLRAKTAGTGNFKVRIEDNVANALEISDATNALSFMVFDTTDDAELINLNQDIVVKGEVNLHNTNSNGLFFNSNRSGAASSDATLITIEGGNDKNDVVLAWDTTDNALNLNAESQIHLQGLNGSNALTIGGALVENATIVMTTAGAITLDGTLDAGALDSVSLNTNKITNKNDTSLVVELPDTEASALVIREGAGGESYITINTTAETTTLNQATSFSSTVEITGDATLDASLKIKYIDGLTTPLILANSDRIAEGQEADAILLEVERGILANAKIKWDETSDVFEFDKTLSAEANFQVGIDAAAPKATINSTTGNLSTDGTISATSSITTDSVLNFTTASQGAIVFNSDLGNGAAPADADDFGLTVNRGNTTDAKLYWDEGDDAWKIETGNVQVQNSLVVDSDANGKITISDGSIVSGSGAISFDNENLSTTGTITAAKPADRVDDSTQVPTTSWVLDLRLGDFDQVDTTGFNANDQVLVWDQDNSNFKAGTAIYAAENARDDVGAALEGGTHTGATTITFTNDDANDVINLALGITTEDLTDVSTNQATNNQVLRFTTAEGDNQNKYVPTTLGSAADVDTGLSNGNVPLLSTHFYSTKTNETADLIITGRYVESIDYGLVSEAFNENTDWAIDCGSVTDTGISSWEDYGQLVV